MNAKAVWLCEISAPDGARVDLVAATEAVALAWLQGKHTQQLEGAQRMLRHFAADARKRDIPNAPKRTWQITAIEASHTGGWLFNSPVDCYSITPIIPAERLP